MGVYPSKRTHGCICLHFLTDKLTDRQTDRQSFSKSRECVFLHLFTFIGIRFERLALEALFLQTCSLHTVRLKHNIRGLYKKLWYQNQQLQVTVFSDLCQNERRNWQCSFARTAHSTYSLCSAPLWYAHLAMLACSIHRIAHSLRSLPRGAVEIRVIAFNRK